MEEEEEGGGRGGRREDENKEDTRNALAPTAIYPFHDQNTQGNFLIIFFEYYAQFYPLGRNR